MKSRKSISKTLAGLSAKENLNKILNDRVSGASSIESDIISYFIKLHNFKSSRTTYNAVSSFEKRFGQMANIMSLLNLIKLQYENNPDSILTVLRKYRMESTEAKFSTIIKTSSLISRYNSIFTVSNSTIIREAITFANNSGWRGEVNVIESRPMNEGSLLAKKLARKSIKVNLAVDSTIYDLIKISGAVFLGADAVTEIYFVNKIGSKLAVMIANELNKKVYVSAEPSKYISRHYYAFSQDSKKPMEILTTTSKNLSIRNYYFEKIIPSGKLNYIRGNCVIKPSELELI